MNIELQEKLFNDFPQLFQYNNLPMTECLMCFGCECGDGWFDIIYQACKEMMKTNPPKEAGFFQIKEKWGSLRLYMDDATDDMREIIYDAEEKSNSVCENCGSTEDVRKTKGGWIKTLCGQCRNNKQ
jgi:hypothetical protein